ncbi:MAG: DMT family transporter, partial [Coriobacteriales bacterium]|nr:DMT family transporter [Coriobacteriales bacterium]
MPRTSSLLSVVASAFLFGTMAILTPLAYRSGAEPLPLLTWRFLLASALLFALVSVRDVSSIRVPKTDVARFAVLALTGYGAASICFAFALKVTDASVVAVLLYTFPAMVTVAGWVFEGQPVRRGQVIAVMMTFGGIVLVIDPFGPGVTVSPAGVALGLGAAVGYSAFSLLSARWLPGRPRLVLMSWTFAFAALLAAAAALGLAFAQGESVIGALSPAGWSSTVWALLIAIVLMPTFGAVVLYLEGIRGLGAAQAALVSMLEPLFTIVLAWFILGERLAPVQLAGAALVLAGVVVAERSARRDV